MNKITTLIENLNLMPIAIGASTIVLLMAVALVLSQRKRVREVNKAEFYDR